jgi:hypothetical protein
MKGTIPTRRHAQRKLQEKAQPQLNPSPLNAWSGDTANGPSLLVARSDSADVLFGLSTGSGTGQVPGLDLRKRYRDLFGTEPVITVISDLGDDAITSLHDVAAKL